MPQPSTLLAGPLVPSRVLVVRPAPASQDAVDGAPVPVGHPTVLLDAAQQSHEPSPLAPELLHAASEAMHLGLKVRVLVVGTCWHHVLVLYD